MKILRERDVEFDVIEYIKQPPDRSTLGRIVRLLPVRPIELVRQDKNFQELGLEAADYPTADAVVEILLEYPMLMQRPIFVVGDRAVIARPADKVLELL